MGNINVRIVGQGLNQTFLNVPSVRTKGGGENTSFYPHFVDKGGSANVDKRKGGRAYPQNVDKKTCFF